MKPFLFILSFLIVFGIVSCDNNKEKEIEGRWELVTKPVGDYLFFWEMKGGQISVTYSDSSFSFIDTCAKGTYIIKNGVFSVVAPIEFCEFSTYDGEWEIQKLDGKYLTLLRYLPRGTLWLEFAKR